MATKQKRERIKVSSQSLSIGALSRATKIPVETLRTWERRYGFPIPVRKPSGHRIYPATAVEQLRRVGRLLALGHRPAEVLSLAPREVDALLSLSDPRPALDPPPSPALESEPTHALRDLMAATKEFDRAAMLHVLRTSWLRLGPLRFLEELAGPFLVEVGRAWHAGEVEVRHEHFASACVSDFLRSAREPYDHRARGPRVLVSTLPGEEHEGGLLIVAALLALRGHRVLYLGASTPIAQIAAAARSGSAEVVAISISAATPRARSTKAIAELRESLPARLPIWLGGAGAPPAIKGVERFDSLTALDARLAAEP